jgi:hypothetical protein
MWSGYCLYVEDLSKSSKRSTQTFVPKINSVAIKFSKRFKMYESKNGIYTKYWTKVKLKFKT